MRYIADIEKHGVVVADTDTDSLILYSDEYCNKFEGTTELRPTCMLTEDIAGYFPSHMLTGEMQNTYAIVHPDDLINHIKQYMVFPEDKDWLFNIVNNKASTVLAHDIKGVFMDTGSQGEYCIPLVFDSSEMGIAVTERAGVIARFKTASGAFRAVQIAYVDHDTAKWPQRVFKCCQLYDGGLLVYLLKGESNGEKMYIKREADNLISIRLYSRLHRSSTVFSYCPDMDIITMQTDGGTAGEGGVINDLSDYVFDDGVGLYVRCFDNNYYQFATPLRGLEKPVSEGYSFLHRYNYYEVYVNGIASLYNWTRLADERIDAGQIYTKNVNGVALNYNYEYIFNDNYDAAVVRFRLTGVENGHYMVTDTITGSKYTVDDIAKRVLPCEYIFDAKYSLEDYAKIRLGLIDVINDKQIRRNIQLRLNFLGVALDFDSAVAIEIDIPDSLFSLIGMLAPTHKKDKDWDDGDYYDKFCIIKTEQDHFDLFRITCNRHWRLSHGSKKGGKRIHPVVNIDCSYLETRADLLNSDDYTGSRYQAMHYIEVNDDSATYCDLLKHKEMHGQFYNLEGTQEGSFIGESLVSALGLS